MTYVLILFMSIGMMSDKDSMALTNVPGFATQASCTMAGDTAIKAFYKGTKEAKYICVPMPK